MSALLLGLLSGPGVASAAGPLTGVVSISTGATHSCAVQTNTQILCWGNNNQGQLGNGTVEYLGLTPVVTSLGGPPLTGAISVSVGVEHSCAVLNNGEARCWGWNAGSLGDGTTADRLVPVAVVVNRGGRPLTGITGVQTGGYHSCALLVSGEARCWGLNTSGQLGNGSTVQQSLQPVTVLDGSSRQRRMPQSGIVGLSGGQEYSCALLSSGQARCWGLNTSLQLGSGTDVPLSSLPLTVMTT